MSETIEAKEAKVIPIDDTAAVREYEKLVEDFDTKDFNLVRDGDPEVASGIWDAEMRAFIDSMSLKTMFFTEDWVFIAVDKIASKLSHLPLRVMKQVVENGKKRVEPNENHPIQKLLEKPNLYQGQTSFVYTSLVDLIVLGNIIIWHSQATNQLIGIPAELVRLDFDRNGFLSRYVVQQWWGSETNVPWKAGLTFDSAQIIHVRRPNPSSLLWGMSPLIPGRKSILFNRYSSEFLVNFYLKGATPQMALTLDKEANEKNALRLLRSFEQAYLGRKNQRRTLVLPKGVTADSLTQTLADQDLKEYVRINRETIINILGVPKHELSIAEAGSLGSEEAKQAIKNFWESVLKPTGKMFTDALTAKFALDLGPNNIIEFDYSDVEALRDDMMKKAQIAEVMLKTHTINEVREKLYEDPPLPGGDQTPPIAGTGGQQMVFGHPIEPKGAMQPQGGFTGGKPTPWSFFAQSQDPNGAMGPPSPYQDPRYQTGQGPAPDQRQQLSDEEVQTPEDKPIDSQKKARAHELKNGHNGWFHNRQEKINSGVAHHLDAMHKASLNHFVDIAHTSVKTAKRFLASKNYEAQRLKAPVDPKDKDPRKIQRSFVMNKAELRKALTKAYSKLEPDWVNDSVKILQGAVDLGYDVQLQVPYKLPSTNEIQALKLEGDKHRKATLEDRQIQTFQYMTGTTTDKVMDTINKGVEGGKTVNEIGEDIADKFRDVDSINGRAMTIARTETLTAVSMGQQAALEDASSVIPGIKKMWVSTQDDRTRGPGSIYGYKAGDPDHESLDGEVVGADEKFSNGLSYPRDPDGAPEETINCRCAWVMMPPEPQEGGA